MLCLSLLNTFFMLKIFDFVFFIVVFLVENFYSCVLYRFILFYKGMYIYLYFFSEKFKGNLYLWVKMLLPAVEKRIYNLQTTQIIKIFSKVSLFIHCFLCIFTYFCDQ